MKIYIQGTQTEDYQRFYWKIGEHYLLELYGINIDTRDTDVYVEPVYQPRLSISKAPLLFTLRLWKMKYLNVLFMPFFPWVKVYQTNAIQLDIEEDK